MCLPKIPKPQAQTPPAAAPPPAEASAQVAQGAPDTNDSLSLEDRARRRGRSALRIDRTSNAGSGLNIPQG